MDNFLDMELFVGGRWIPAATVDIRGGGPGAVKATGTTYEAVYALANEGRVDALAVGANVPVCFEFQAQQGLPPFMGDLIPGGYGRQLWLRELGLPETAGPSADWALLMAGAGNSIGNMRVRQAAERLRDRGHRDRLGFTEGEVAGRGATFVDHLVTLGLPVAGSAGVQGDWPKILLTVGRDGRYYLDHALPDDEAQSHWLVKFPHGPSEALATILRLEMPYMELARHLGLRAHGEIRGTAGTLFIPRFDRDAVGGEVHRHAQESLASLCGLAGFGVVPTHNEACARLAAVCTDPVSDIAEYLRRDVANVVLGNKDNHARNTAIQRRDDGFIGLTPLFDFAPMMLHPDGIARRMRWKVDDGGHPRWGSVVVQAALASGVDRSVLVDTLRRMVGPLRSLRARALEMGIDAFVMDMQRPVIDNVIAQLSLL